MRFLNIDGEMRRRELGRESENVKELCIAPDFQLLLELDKGFEYRSCNGLGKMALKLWNFF